jgi:hypothetical protein
MGGMQPWQGALNVVCRSSRPHTLSGMRNVQKPQDWTGSEVQQCRSQLAFTNLQCEQENVPSRQTSLALQDSKRRSSTGRWAPPSTGQTWPPAHGPYMSVRTPFASVSSTLSPGPERTSRRVRAGPVFAIVCRGDEANATSASYVDDLRDAPHSHPHGRDACGCIQLDKTSSALGRSNGLSSKACSLQCKEEGRSCVVT